MLYRSFVHRFGGGLAALTGLAVLAGCATPPAPTTPAPTPTPQPQVISSPWQSTAPAVTAPPGMSALPSVPTGTVRVFQSRGARQCGDRGTSPETMQRELQRAGIAVTRSACGHDGVSRPALCGAGTGDINLFDIAAADLPRAERLGFLDLQRTVRDGVSSAREAACR